MLGDRIAILIDSKIHQIGSSEEIYYNPGTLEVAKFMLNQNIFEGKIDKRNEKEVFICSSGFEIKSVNSKDFKVGDPVFFGIRPEEIMLIRPDRPISQIVKDNLFEGKIIRIFEKGGNHIIFVKVENIDKELEINIPNCAYRDMKLFKDKNIKVSLKKSSIWVLPQLN